MPPLPLDPEECALPLNRTTKRVTMDFSLLTVPLPDLLLDRDSEIQKAAADSGPDGGHGENGPVQVLSVTLGGSPSAHHKPFI